MGQGQAHQELVLELAPLATAGLREEKLRSIQRSQGSTAAWPAGDELLTWVSLGEPLPFSMRGGRLHPSLGNVLQRPAVLRAEMFLLIPDCASPISVYACHPSSLRHTPPCRAWLHLLNNLIGRTVLGPLKAFSSWVLASAFPGTTCFELCPMTLIFYFIPLLALFQPEKVKTPKLEPIQAQLHDLITNPNSCAPQVTLSSKGFGTDLPLVNSQVEEHNIFHNEVMAIGPRMAKDGNKVSSPAPLPAALQRQPCPELLMKVRAPHQPGAGWVGAQTHIYPRSSALTLPS